MTPPRGSEACQDASALPLGCGAAVPGSRRIPVAFMKSRLLVAFLVLASLTSSTFRLRAADHPPAPAVDAAPAVATGHTSGDGVGAAAALERLIEGNKRFHEGQPRHPHQARDWRDSLEKGQKPFAVVLGCSDSRVPPELVFDQGFGDLFVIRVAGNIADEDGIGSIEYAVDHLDVHLVVILGHSSCGAVSAALDYLSDAADEPSEIVSLLYRIEPALAGIPKDLDRSSQVALAVKRNVDLAIRRLSRVADIRKNLRTAQLKIVGAVYDMHTGKVQFLP